MNHDMHRRPIVLLLVVLVLSVGGFGRAAPQGLRPAHASGAANAGAARRVTVPPVAQGHLASGSAPSGVIALGVSQGTGVVYAAAAGGLYRSDTPPYQTWTRVNTMASVPRPVTGIYPNPTAAGALFILAGGGGSAGQAYRSADGGATLAASAIFTETTQVTDLAWALPDPLSPSASSASVSRLYATGADSENAYVARSDDGGATWRLVLTKAGEYAPETINALAVAPGQGGSTALIAANEYHGGSLEETTDGGATWIDDQGGSSLTAPSTQLSFTAPDYVAVSPVDAASIWTWWNHALWQSADGGHTWSSANAGIAAYSAAFPFDIAMRFLPRQQIALLRVNADLYRSLPGGGWAQVPIPGHIGSALATVWRGGYLIAATAAGRLLVLPAAHLPQAAPGPTPQGTWTLTHPVLPIRGGQTATLLPDGSVLVAGGDASTSSVQPGATREAQLFDPVSGRWSRLPDMHDARTAHTATLLADGRVLVAGGFDQSFNALSSVEIYDPGTRHWSMAASLGSARGAHTATLLPDHRVLVAGGRDQVDTAIMPAELYDPASGAWAAAGALPRELRDSAGLSTAALLPTGDVLLLNPRATGPTAAVVYTPRTNTWNVLAGTPLAGLTGVMVATLHDGRLLASGGEIESGASFNPVPTTALYDARTGAWRAAAPLPTALAGGAAVTLRDGRVLVVGGLTWAGATAAAEIYDPRMNRWTPAQPMRAPGGSTASTATLLRDVRVLVLGGGAGGAEIFDPGDRVTPATQPASSAPGALYVAATDHSVAAPFVATYRRLGPYLLGHPLTEAYRQQGVLVQLFEHLRLELRAGRVVVGDLGRQLYHPDHPAPRRAAVPDTPTRRYFPRTGQVVAGAFLAFWQAQGGEAVFGAPLSGVVWQRNGDGSGRVYATQWFEKACLELHPENANPRFRVLLRLLGRDWLRQRGWA